MATSQWYNWFGLNEWLFKEINSFHMEGYDSIMIALTHMGDYHNLPYIVGFLLIFALTDYGRRKLLKRGGAAHCLVAWLGVLCVLGGSFVIDGATVKTMKNHFAYPRPYVALGPEDVTVLEYREDPAEDYKSFPSGHASFITLLVASLWPVLSRGMCKVGLGIIFGVCWSRIAEGVHFPVDVVAGALLSFAIVTVVRAVLYKQLLKLHIRC